jgi:hypothetical protein
MSAVVRVNFKDSLKKQMLDNANNKEKSLMKAYFDDSKMEGIEFYKIKEDNLIDIIPYIVKTKNHSKKLAIGSGDYVLEIFTHRDIGIENKEYLCLRRMYGKACPVCEEMQRLKEEGSEEESKKLWPKHRTLYNVIDLNEEEKGIQLFDVTFKWIESVLRKNALKDGQIITFADLEEGCSVQFAGNPEEFITGSKKKIEFKRPVALKFVERDGLYDESILEESYSLDSFLCVPTYQEVYDAYYEVEKKDEKPKEIEEIEEEKVEEPVVDNKVKKFKKVIRKEQSNDIKTCPEGFTFGVDYDEYDECSECDKKKICEVHIDL